MSSPPSSRSRLFVAAGAAFATYFCMYAFRKPFTAAEFEGETWRGAGLKSVLVVAQLAGYMLSKFIGIKVVSEMRREHRATAIVGLILVAELALVGFAYGPPSLRIPMMFLNGLPLGMVFGLVLGYLEGRRHTEALTAALCASFIVSSGVVKSVGRTMVTDWGVSEFEMPMYVGLLFLVPLLLSVWVLRTTPPPDDEDVSLRTERETMDATSRARFAGAYWPTLALMLVVYIALTVARTIRDDFAVEIWGDMGVDEKPSVFARSETIVGVLVTAACALAIRIRDNLRAIRVTTLAMTAAFGLVFLSAVLVRSGTLSPFVFMVACGVGLYVPYVAFHTTIFERMIAASDRPCNLGFLMYVADAVGYLGYAAVLLIGDDVVGEGRALPFFLSTLLVVAVLSCVALPLAVGRFDRSLHAERTGDAVPAEG